MRWTTKAIIIAALLMGAFTALACDEGRAGYCKPPTPCQSAQGGNP